ncbi:hypothetical protein JW979_01860 [bacterium]|nr:hypothetical protein [candidate division CSSED10-310 bacterium]
MARIINGDVMAKGIAYINREFRYQIHATNRTDPRFGLILVDANMDDFDAKITIFDSGKIIIQSPKRRVEINLKDGSMQCES